MFKLSSYVADPLTLKASIWQHPITGQSVGLSDELRVMLPDIAQQNLEQEGEGPEEVLQQLLAAELAARGFLIPLAWQTREDEYLAEIAPLRPVETALFSMSSCDRLALPAYARLAVFSAALSDPSESKNQPTGAERVRQLCRMPARASTYYSLSSGKALSLDLGFDLGRKVAGGLSRTSLLKQTSQLVAQLPRACTPLILADEAVWTYSLLKGLTQREGAPGHLLIFDDTLRFQPESAAAQMLPPLSSENLLNHLKEAFPDTRLYGIGLNSYQTLPEGAPGQECLAATRRLGPQLTLQAAAQLSAHEWERLLPRAAGREEKLVLALNAELLCPHYQGLWSSASILASLCVLLQQNRVQGLVVWGLEGLAEGPASTVRQLLLTLIEGALR